MILEDILCEVKDQVMATGYFSEFYEFAEMTNTLTQDGTKSYPRYYLSDGQYKDLYDFDVNGTGYIRKTSSVSTRKLQDRTKSCQDEWLELNYPMRLVAGVPKINDNTYSDETLIFELLEVLQGNVNNISNTREVVITVDRYETDRNRVWSSEVSGLEEIIRLELSYIYIDFNLKVIVKSDCLIPDCYG